jgi:hypothetical protein
MTLEEAMALAAADMDEFFVEKIIRHAGRGNNPKLELLGPLVGLWRWGDTWLSWAAVKDLEALQIYADPNGIKLSEENLRSGKWDNSVWIVIVMDWNLEYLNLNLGFG